MGLSMFLSLKNDDLVVLLFEEIVKLCSLLFRPYSNEFSFWFDMLEFPDMFEPLRHDFLGPLFFFYGIFDTSIEFITFEV